jgi:hypothetical protein
MAAGQPSSLSLFMRTVLVQMGSVQVNYIRQILEHAKALSLGKERSDAF